MEEKIEILNDHKGEMVYVEYTNAKTPTSLVGVISNEFQNSHIKLWYMNNGRLDSVFIPIFGIKLIANYNYVWSQDKEHLYYAALEIENKKVLKK